MKKKICIIFISLCLFLIGIWFFWPRPMGRLLTGEGTMTITESSIKDGKAVMRHVEMNKADPAFAELREILSGYTYHPNLRTILSEEMIGRTYGDSLTITLGDTVFSVENSGYVQIDGRKYHIGYWGKEQSEELYNQIYEILESLVSTE